MNRKNRTVLADRVVRAAEAALARQDYVSPIDALVGIGWLEVRTVEPWRRGQIDCLERAMQTNLARILEALKLFQSWAAGKRLVRKPDGLCSARTATSDAALQPKRRPCHRGAVSDPLGITRAFREETRTIGRESQPCPGSGGGPAVEQGMDIPLMWRQRQSRASGADAVRFADLTETLADGRSDFLACCTRRQARELR
jgi:hypothetical protein